MVSLNTQGPIVVTEPVLDTQSGRRFSAFLNSAATVVSQAPTIKREFTQVPPNQMPFFRTDGIKGGFRGQALQPFDPRLLDDVEGNLFIEEKRLINRRLNPFLTPGDLSADIIGRQVSSF